MTGRIKNRTTRNIWIFIIISLLSGWIGYGIDQSLEQAPEAETLGMAVWLVLPLLTTVLLRLFAGDGWKDIGLNPNFKGNLSWYMISLIVFPGVTLLVLSIGKILGWVSFDNFNGGVYTAGLIATLLPNFIKNIFEEFVWRGYLTAKLVKRDIKDIWIYLIVGGVWGAWHLPYYLFFLPESYMFQVLPVERLAFALIAIATMIIWTVMFVEIYRLTKSIWPAVTLHMMEDSTINHLIIDEHLTIASGKEILISPIMGIITALFYLILGLWLRRVRKIKETTDKINGS